MSWSALLLIPVVSALEFREDGTFRIVQFTDMHFDGNQVHTKQTLEIMDAVLDFERPDFVAYTGDLCNGGNPTPSCYTATMHGHVLDTAFSPVNRRGIPWAITFGNWDRHPETFWNGTELTDHILTHFPQSLNRKPPSGVRGDSVFDLPVTHKGTDAAVLYFIDTHANDGCHGIHGTGCIYPTEVTWYNATSASYRRKNGGKPLPAVVFHHIPLKGYLDGWNTDIAYGRLDEALKTSGRGISCAIDDSGFFDLAVENGDVLAMACGHDHSNDFHVSHRGIQLMYGRKSGMGSYGPDPSWGSYPSKDGARVIQLRLNPVTSEVTVDSWIRLFDGTVVDQASEGVHANSEDNHQYLCNAAAAATVLYA